MTRSTLITFNFVFLLPEFMLFENRKKVLGQIIQGKKYQINDVNQKNKLVYAWPLDNTHSFQWYGDSRVLEFPIVQDGIEFKRFNPKCVPEDYMDPKELGIKTTMENNVCLNVRKRFIEIMDRVL